ncbi:MAG: alpha/beta fold hydrolase [Verrucomicrobia bacterium]|nr:alpha/beta fold hydrolase [Verrucomicrobiota bacterium]
MKHSGHLQGEWSGREEHGAPERTALLLHGMFGKAVHWASCADHLTERLWKVMVPDLPVFDMPRHETGIEGLARRATELMDHEGIQRAVIGGNSLGGHIALQMALRYPQRVAALILTGSSGLFERSFQNRVPRRPSRDWLRAKAREVFYDEAHVTESLLNEIKDTVCDPRRALNIIRIAKSAKHDNLRHVLHQIRCPVLLAWGEDDNITPPSVAHEFKECLPDAELHFIPRCGHAPMMERPHEFNQIVERFLDRVSAPHRLAAEPAVCCS